MRVMHHTDMEAAFNASAQASEYPSEEVLLMYDDIDWMNASSDLGLVLVCQEMTATAGVTDASPKPPSKRRRRNRTTTRVGSGPSLGQRTKVSAA